MANEVTKTNGKGGAVEAFDPSKYAAMAGNLVKSGAPRVDFLKMDKTGEWVYGQDETPVEPEDRAYIDPDGFVHGWQCWANTDLPNVQAALLGSEMAPMDEALPERPAKVPEDGRAWSEAVGMSCVINGVKMVYTTNSVGGRNAFAELGQEYIKQGKRDPSRLIAVVKLESDSYKHKNKTYGRIYVPIITVVEWVDALPEQAVNGAPAEPEPTPAKKAAKPRAKAK